MSGATPLVPLSAFMLQMGKTLPLLYPIKTDLHLSSIILRITKLSKTYLFVG
jgi:hypothetical protein